MTRYSYRPTEYIEIRPDGSRGLRFYGRDRNRYVYRIADRELKYDDSVYPVVVYPLVYVKDLYLVSDLNPELPF